MQNQGGPTGFPGSGQSGQGMIPQGNAALSQQMYAQQQQQQQMYQSGGMGGGMRPGMPMGYQGQGMPPMQQGAGSMMGGGMGYQGPAGQGPPGPMAGRGYGPGYGPGQGMGQFPPQMGAGSGGIGGMSSSASFAAGPTGGPGAAYMSQAGMGPQMGQNMPPQHTPGQYPASQSSSIHLNQASSSSSLGIPPQMVGAAGALGQPMSTGPQSQSSQSVNPHSVQSTSAQPPQQPVREAEQAKHRPLHPAQYSSEVLDNLKKYNVPQLCTIGRELVHDLAVRTAMFAQTMKGISEKPSARSQMATCDPEQLLEYCQLLLNKLVEIRLRIEKQMPKAKFDTDAFLAKMATPGDDEVSEKLQNEKQIFKDNRDRLIRLSSDLKMLDWMASVADPHYLKRVDKLKGSSSAASNGY